MDDAEVEEHRQHASAIAWRFSAEALAKVGFTREDAMSIAWAALCRGNTYAWSECCEAMRSAGVRRPRHMVFSAELPADSLAVEPGIAEVELADAWRWVRGQFDKRDQVILDHLIEAAQDPVRSGPSRGAWPRGGALRAARVLGITESAVCHRRRKIEQRLPELLRRAGLQLGAELAEKLLADGCL